MRESERETGERVREGKQVMKEPERETGERTKRRRITVKKGKTTSKEVAIMLTVLNGRRWERGGGEIERHAWVEVYKASDLLYTIQ